MFGTRIETLETTERKLKAETGDLSPPSFPDTALRPPKDILTDQKSLVRPSTSFKGEGAES